MGNQAKGIQIMDYLSRLQADVFMTRNPFNWCENHNTEVTSGFPCIFVNYNSRKTRTAVLVHNTITVTHNSTIADTDGCFVMSILITP